MRNKQTKILKPDYIGTGLNASQNRNELSRDELRNKFLQRAVKKHEGLLTRLSRT